MDMFLSVWWPLRVVTGHKGPASVQWAVTYFLSLNHVPDPDREEPGMTSGREAAVNRSHRNCTRFAR
eukprot:CAMPEP_0179017132 /NCGR_PEP_ID=MMETSP0796-20121207/3682_1 /TAXON_ID=73915 /ORGANISM="Pyrodinium bahamense, Strain pbaha01" /LENGTH=66 /DNA_ID=CAMNT_0020712853 /DNA_START=20 /DNA_END=216 /DNA_ORIENTATION=+